MLCDTLQPPPAWHRECGLCGLFFFRFTLFALVGDMPIADTHSVFAVSVEPGGFGRELCVQIISASLERAHLYLRQQRYGYSALSYHRWLGSNLCLARDFFLVWSFSLILREIICACMANVQAIHIFSKFETRTYPSFQTENFVGNMHKF